MQSVRLYVPIIFVTKSNLMNLVTISWSVSDIPVVAWPFLYIFSPIYRSRKKKEGMLLSLHFHFNELVLVEMVEIALKPNLQGQRVKMRCLFTLQSSVHRKSPATIMFPPCHSYCALWEVLHQSNPHISASQTVL